MANTLRKAVIFGYYLILWILYYLPVDSCCVEELSVVGSNGFWKKNAKEMVARILKMRLYLCAAYGCAPKVLAINSTIE